MLKVDNFSSNYAVQNRVNNNNINFQGYVAKSTWKYIDTLEKMTIKDTILKDPKEALANKSVIEMAETECDRHKAEIMKQKEFDRQVRKLIRDNTQTFVLVN